MTTTAGPLAFARFAFPPNALGYCGPDAPSELLDYVSAQVSDNGLVQLARGFTGAWPYLELIAGAAGIEDPLDPRVVEAYWVGSPLLDTVPSGLLARTLDDRFGRRSAVALDLPALVAAGARPHHNLHVFGVYPWVGALRGGVLGEPLHVLDQCRIRWGTVLMTTTELAVVRSRPLVWTDRLELGPAVVAEVRCGDQGRALAHGVEPGDVVALHWDWICDRLDPARLRQLIHHTSLALSAVNACPSARVLVGA